MGGLRPDAGQHLHPRKTHSTSRPQGSFCPSQTGVLRWQPSASALSHLLNCDTFLARPLVPIRTWGLPGQEGGSTVLQTAHLIPHPAHLTSRFN